MYYEPIPIIIIKGRTYSNEDHKIQSKGKSRPLTKKEIEYYVSHLEEMTDDIILIDIHGEPYLYNELDGRRLIYNGKSYY